MHLPPQRKSRIRKTSLAFLSKKFYHTTPNKKSIRRCAMTEEEIGRVSDFFAQPVVAGIKLSGKLKKGDTVHIKGHTTDLIFAASSIQVNHDEVAEATPRESIGIKVPDRVRRGDVVYRVTS
jgi:hypothetical protein